MTKYFTPRHAFFILLLLPFCHSKATIYNTVGDGVWSSPAVWSGGIVAPNPIGATDTVNIQHGVTLANNLFVFAGGMLNVNMNGYLDMTGFSLVNRSNGGGISMGGVNIYGTILCNYVRNFGFSWIFIEPTGALIVFGDIDNLGDIYVSGLLDLSNGDFNHLAADIWIYAGGNITISNGDFNNYSTIRNLFPSSCIRLLGGSFVNQAGGIVAGNGGVSADVNVDNSANPMANWIGVTWCAGVAGINVPPALEDCAGPCTGPLQVEIASFEAIAQQDGVVRIEWATATEINSGRFLVERTYDLEEYEKVGEVTAAGESSSLTSYEILDEGHEGGLIHYRLTEIDLDGSASVYENLVSAFVELPEQAFVMYPNPSVGATRVLVDASKVGNSVVAVFDQLGAEVMRRQVENEVEVLDLAGKPAGVYLVSIQTGSKSETKKLILH